MSGCFTRFNAKLDKQDARLECCLVSKDKKRKNCQSGLSPPLVLAVKNPAFIATIQVSTSSKTGGHLQVKKGLLYVALFISSRDIATNMRRISNVIVPIALWGFKTELLLPKEDG
ncbi:uncharacterized protein PHALS_09467 [Plasmopara halstedii]|uniref:Uncharacterized protein n=1 Tax=Plasmopara halstedii TaxID=4781 RepID=A0A0P1A5F9_PLAHL|nr:uncharacterized protein PHALS_09467 [Plasmopara halstedii]CEG35341.1 hypothetical protein PHALS_09467 [Plasmopara halstedii]|eukprot:XP_024571710.1 hypothetical protein PHALS_09467 [Plasmopara halstedii]